MTEFIRNNLITYLIVMLGIAFIFPLGALELGREYYVIAFGAKILVFLLYGVSILPAVVLAKLTYMLFISDVSADPTMAVHLSLISAAMPAIAMYAMNFTGVSNIRDLKNLDFRHIVFFIGLTSILSSLTKFIYMSNFMALDHQAAQFLLQYISGHLIGGTLIVYLVVKFSPQILSFISRILRVK